MIFFQLWLIFLLASILQFRFSELDLRSVFLLRISGYEIFGWKDGVY
jgi:hypothetical protein